VFSDTIPSECGHTGGIAMSMSSLLRIEIPDGINPVAKLIETEVVTRHIIANHAYCITEYCKPDDMLAMIQMATFQITNFYLVFIGFIGYMPDTKAAALLILLLDEMNKLVNSFRDINSEEVGLIAQKRENFIALVDNIVVAHYKLVDYLKSLQHSV